MLAVISTFVLVGVMFSLIIPFIVQSISTFISGIDQYQDRVISFVQTLSNSEIVRIFQIDQQSITKSIKSLPILDLTTSFLGNAANILTNTFLVLVFLLFILLGNKSQKRENRYLASN